MIPIPEFLALCPPGLDLKVLREWQHSADYPFVEYVLHHHSELDYPHLRCAMRILQNVDRHDVRELFVQYLSHAEAGLRAMAQGSLDEQLKRGWCSETPASVNLSTKS